MKALGGLILGASLLVFAWTWLVSSDAGTAQSVFVWSTVLALVGLGLFGYGIYSDQKAE